MRRWIVLAAAILLGGVAVWAALGLGGASGTAQPSSAPPATVAVERRDLVRTVTVDGTVGFGTPQPLAVKASGTVTWLAGAGSTVRRGQTLVRVDDLPVVLLYGVLPAYRDLAAGAEGSDVVQLETNLKAMGYTGFTVDREFSAATTAAVKHWQRDLGVPDTGAVGLAQVVYAPGPLRISDPVVRLGAAAPADVLNVTGTTKTVTAAIPTADAGWASVGAAVAVEAATPVAGRVQAVVEPSPDAGGGPATVAVTIAVADQKALAQDRGTVTVRYTAEHRENVLTVPVSALLALAEGGYGVERADGGIVAVTVGMFADGRVEISGSGVADGVSVRVPR
jgi:peptidoglycan hydrolase-like protein with peptidoglycan-binding domain